MKLIRAYIITAVVCLSVTATAACVFIADENAKKISLGQDNAVLVLSSSQEQIYPGAVNPASALKELAEAAKTAASIAPPPISNIYWFAVSLAKN